MIAILLSAGLLVGCDEGPECAEDSPCPFGSVCVEGTCEARYCATSAQCEMQQYCADGVCTEGCADDGDCYPGETCDIELAECVPQGCSDTQRDCAYKEFCDTSSGECFQASGYYCQECGGDADCGGNDNTCYGGYCAPTCSTDEDCPAAFTCVPFVDLSGNIQYYGCYTYCWLFEDGDYSEIEAERSAAVAVPLDELLGIPECLPADAEEGRW